MDWQESLSRAQGQSSNTRDDLLLSLLASEAIVESRDFTILSSEEIDDLKKEDIRLSSRPSSLEKKLETERKIRDASTTLSTLSVPRNKVSKSTPSNEQLETATKRFDETQNEVWRVSQAKSDVSRRLVEHRAKVLSASVRRIEEDKRGDMFNGYGTPTNLLSPASSAFSFFAGHPSSTVPSSSSLLPQAAQQGTVAVRERSGWEERAMLEQMQQAKGGADAMLAESQLEQSHAEVPEDLDSGLAFVQTKSCNSSVSRDPSLKGLTTSWMMSKPRRRVQRHCRGWRRHGEHEALQAELVKVKKELKEALEEMEAMQMSSQAQNVMLMDKPYGHAVGECFMCFIPLPVLYSWDDYLLDAFPFPFQ
ncbi:Up-regulated during septation-domain-containing protein [Lentinula edodes]|nr:Up-regulated during septation-domain-containing protein [Lentinula edodes]